MNGATPVQERKINAPKASSVVRIEVMNPRTTLIIVNPIRMGEDLVILKTGYQFRLFDW
jgi:hypothetical protein